MALFVAQKLVVRACMDVDTDNQLHGFVLIGDNSRQNVHTLWMIVLHDINQIKVKKSLVFLRHILFFGQEFGIFF